MQLLQRKYSFRRAGARESTVFIEPAFAKVMFLWSRRLRKYCFYRAGVRESTVFVEPAIGKSLLAADFVSSM